MAKARCIFGATVLTPVVLFGLLVVMGLAACCVLTIMLGVVWLTNKVPELSFCLFLASAVPGVLATWSALYAKCDSHMTTREP